MKKFIRLLPLVFIALIALQKSQSIMEFLVSFILVVIGIVGMLKKIRTYLCSIVAIFTYFIKYFFASLMHRVADVVRNPVFL